MPQKLNTEFNYRYQTLGDTPWAKIQNLKGFLEGRVRAVALETVTHLKHDAKVAELEHLKETKAPLHEILLKQAEMVEAESHMIVVDEAYELNRQEIKILNKVLAELYVIAEPTRIAGYSDEEMFEANAAAEFTANTLRAMQSEIVANGRPFPATVLHVMSNPDTLLAAVNSGLFPADVVKLMLTTPPVFLTANNKQSILEVADIRYLETVKPMNPELTLPSMN
jgi:hypothetical protein